MAKLVPLNKVLIAPLNSSCRPVPVCTSTRVARRTPAASRRPCTSTFALSSALIVTPLANTVVSSVRTSTPLTLKVGGLADVSISVTVPRSSFSTSMRSAVPVAPSSLMRPRTLTTMPSRSCARVAVLSSMITVALVSS